MTTTTSTELKHRLSELMEVAQHEPVEVSKSGRPYAVIVGRRDYERFLALEDRYWSERAREAQQSGYLSHEESLTSFGRRADELCIALSDED